MNTEKTALEMIAGAARCPEYSPVMISALMKKLDMNEKGFALLMNVTVVVKHFCNTLFEKITTYFVLQMVSSNCYMNAV